MVLFAELGLVLRGHMGLLLEFIVTMSKGTSITKFALTGKFPVTAYLYRKSLGTLDTEGIMDILFKRK